jgi:hypothetical protein
VTVTSAEPIEQERVPQADFATHRKGAKSGWHGYSLMRAGRVTQNLVRNEEIALG